MIIGQGIGKEVIEKIQSAKHRVWIVSPFISSKYSKILASKLNEGVDVRVITMSDVNLPTARIGKYTHAKIYIIDDVCFWGSMNLTESGVERNVEVVEKVTDPNKVAKFEEEFLSLWENSIDIRAFSLCDKVMFVKSWTSHLKGGINSCVAFGDNIYVIENSKNLICFSDKDGKILWKVPVAFPFSYYAVRIRPYSNGYILLYKYFGEKYFDSNKVKIYLIKDGYIITSFEYDGHDPWNVYFDPDKKVICIVEKQENGSYKPIGFDLTGKIVEGYRGRSDVKFFVPSVVRGDGVIEYEIPISENDRYVVSPNNKMLVVIYNYNEVKQKNIYIKKNKDKIIKFRIYNIEAKEVFNEASVNIGNSDLIDFTIDDDGVLYLLTKESVYIIYKNNFKKIEIIKNEPISPSLLKIAKYDEIRSFCESIFLFDKFFAVVIVDEIIYKDGYGEKRFAHILIYSKENLKIVQKIWKVGSQLWIYPIKLKDFLLSKEVDRYYEIIIYFKRSNIQSKIKDFLNTVYKTAPTLGINPKSYILKLSELCENSDVDEIIYWINKESDILISELQNKKKELKEKLDYTLSKLEKAVKNGYNSTKIIELLKLAKDALENIDRNLAEANDKLNFLEDKLHKIESVEPTLNMDIATESVGKYYKVVLKLKTDAEFGVIAELKDIKGNVEVFFENRPVEVCPDANIEVYLKPLEEGPIPIVFKIEYRYFDRVANTEKLILLPKS